MEHKNCTVSLVLFVTMLCIYSRVEFVKASILTKEKVLSKEVYSKSKVIKDTSSRRRRFIQKQDISVDVCADIIGPNWNMPKKQINTSPCHELVVWVPKKDGFTEFVKVNNELKVVGGFSIAIFCHVLQLLPYNVQPNFKPFVNNKGESNGTYDQLIEHIEGKDCHAVAGDVTIRRNRAQRVDFTIPYLSSEVYVLVHGTHEWNETLWTFLRPFTRSLWIAIVVCTCNIRISGRQSQIFMPNLFPTHNGCLVSYFYILFLRRKDT